MNATRARIQHKLPSYLQSFLLSAILAGVGWLIKQNQTLYQLKGEVRGLKTMIMQHMASAHK